MYSFLVIVQEANTRGIDGPVAERKVDTIEEAIKTVKEFAQEYLVDENDKEYEPQFTINLIPTCIY